jgi:hypothetical protein
MLPKYMSQWLKVLLEIPIFIRLDLDLFWQIRILERTMAVRSTNFQPWSQTGIQVIAKSVVVENRILHLRMPHSQGCSVDLKRPIFKRKKGSRTFSLGLS